jgi:hypothetical protein
LTTPNSPRVSVPVLSKTTTLIKARIFKSSPVSNEETVLCR